MIKPLISVVMITYNHETYILQAIEGVLSQEYNEEIELIIANDKSTDSTNERIKGFLARITIPKNICIKYTNHDINKNMMPNFVWALNQANGKYIALCEGDDYWTDPLKLQKQIDFLEQNPNYSLCFHSVTIDNVVRHTLYPEVTAENRDYASDELLLTKTAHTVSFVFKREFIKAGLFLKDAVFGGDVLLILMMAEQGRVFGMQDNMAVYRIHPTGISNLDAKRLGILHQQRFIKQYILFKKSFPSLSKNAINSKIVDHSITVLKYYLKKRNLKAIPVLIRALYYRPDLISKGFKKIIGWKN